MIVGETLIHAEENLENLEHTGKCIREALYNGLPCSCGLNTLRELFLEYKRKLWIEQRTF